MTAAQTIVLLDARRSPRGLRRGLGTTGRAWEPLGDGSDRRIADGAIRDRDGVLHWLDDQRRPHRDGQPARIYPNGSRMWYRHGALHRTDGPAATYANGTEEWWRHGVLHRADGPAVVTCDGREEWWRHGVQQPVPTDER